MQTQTEPLRAARPHFSAFALGPVAVLIWHDRISKEGVESLGRVFKKLSETHDSVGFGLLTIIETEADVDTPPQARDAMGKLLTEHERWLRAAAIAYEADGFKATIVRSVVTAINLLSRSRFPNRVFRDNRQALLWLGEKLGFELHAQAQMQRYLRPLGVRS